MRFLFKLFILSLILFTLLVLGGLYLGLEDRALISRDVQLTPAEVQRAKQLFREHDPRKLKDGELKTVVVSQKEVSLASNYLVHLLGSGGSVVKIHDGSLAAQVTLRLPKNPVGEYLNIELALSQTAELPSFDHLRIGRLEIPGWLADIGLHRGVDLAYAESGHQVSHDVIQNVAMSQDRLKITYQWKTEITDVVRDVLVSEQDGEQLEAYNQRLAKVASGTDAGAHISLVNLMQPLFALAQERSNTGNAEQENRAAILVLSAYINGRGLKRLVPEAESWPSPIQHTVTLRGRKDFSQHFITSAALSMVGGNLISDAIGLFKEVEDSRGGSGFSFADLCADKAGTMFGKQATSANHARKLQKWLADSLSEEDLMPVVHDLPEQMSEGEFKERYGGLNSPGYRQMVKKIDQRIAALRLYQ